MTLPVSAYLPALWAAVGTSLFAAGGLWTLRRRDFLLLQRWLRKGPTQQPRPGISIVVTACNAAPSLAENLPSLLAQRYPAFEVVVADECADAATEDLLKTLEQTHLNLRHVALPEGSAHKSRRRLAATLGIRAARHEWIVLTEVDCRPTGEEWLLRLADEMTEGHDMVVGCATFFDFGRERFPRAATARINAQLPWLYAAQRGRRAALVDSANLAFRRSWFEMSGGYAPTLSFPLDYGENSVLADAYSRKGRVGAVCCHEALVLQAYTGRARFRKMQEEQRRLTAHLSLRAKRVQLRRRFAALSAGLLAVAATSALFATAGFFLVPMFSKLSFALLPAPQQYGLLAASALLLGALLSLLVGRLKRRKALRRLLYGD